MAAGIWVCAEGKHNAVLKRGEKGKPKLYTRELIPGEEL